ncbi:hypothetical protein JTB14_014104 [Gonioctena quinquepunctata]|nr:hypothetical protein JTB14_014104 [Gonioctena quinquepunctata]
MVEQELQQISNGNYPNFYQEQLKDEESEDQHADQESPVVEDQTTFFYPLSDSSFPQDDTPHISTTEIRLPDISKYSEGK